MASGAVVVTNRNPYTAWLLRDGENCLLCEMTRGDIADTVGRLIDDPRLQRDLAAAAARQIEVTYCNWAESCEKIYCVMRDVVEGVRDA
jgi:hypothetical protein